MNGIASSTMADSHGLVTTIIAAAPMNRNRLRSAIEALAPTAALIWVVSAVSRDTISPDSVRSKKAGDRRVTWANTSERTSATTRSPIQVTK